MLSSDVFKAFLTFTYALEESDDGQSFFENFKVTTDPCNGGPCASTTYYAVTPDDLSEMGLKILELAFKAKAMRKELLKSATENKNEHST